MQLSSAGIIWLVKQEKIIVGLILIVVFLSTPPSEEEPELSDREVPVRKKGRPKKKKDPKKKDKEGKPVKAKKRKKIVSFYTINLTAAMASF